MSVNEGPRYSPSDFEDLILDEVREQHASGKAVEVGPLTLTATAKPDLDKFMELMDSQKFRATFERRRRDLQDQSPSAYDMALASAAVRAGWNDQETADLIIYGRRKHVGDVEKALRLDYMTMTLRKVREGVEGEEAVEAIEQHYGSRNEGGEQQKPDRVELLTLVRRALQIEILRIVKYGHEEPEYELFTDEGSVKLGKIDGLISHIHLRNAVAAACGRYIREFTRPRWRAIAQALLDLCEPAEVGEESTDSGILRTWLDDYLTRKHPAEVSEDALLAREPVRQGEKVLLFLDSLKTWLFNARGERITVKWLAREMRRIGSEPQVINCELKGKRTTRETWPVPQARGE